MAHEAAERFQIHGQPDAARVLLSLESVQATAAAVPSFPWIQYHTGLIAYEEALLDGQYMVVNWSSMGRPSSRERIRQAYDESGDPGVSAHARRHAFLLEIDGQRLTDRWEWQAARPAARGAGLGFAVELRHAARPVQVVIHTELDDTAFLVRWLEITNLGDRPAAIGAISPWSGLVWTNDTRSAAWPQGASPFSLGRFRTTGPLREGQFQWESLPDGGLHIENVQGVSGHGAPFFVLRNEATGDNVLGQFAYSGNWQMEFYSDHEPAAWNRSETHLYAKIGLAGPAALRLLQPGESARTPAVHLGAFRGDLDSGVQELHTHLRRSVIPAQPGEAIHLVECNHTGYTLNAQITEEQLIAEIDLAADIGVELFMLDAGWFGDQSGSWITQVGDWEETPLLPRGLLPLFDHARAHGMRCGLWVEIERVGATSKARAAHPDWLMRRHGRIIEQLDLAKPEVARYVEDTIVRLVDRYRLDCFRLDYNIKVGEGGDLEQAGWVESTMWRYYDALYGVFDRVRARFPNLLLENCASGGGRRDLGMMRRFHWTQITDNWAPAQTLKIVNGATLSLPPEQCMTLLGAISAATADLDFMLRIGLFGHFCVSGIFPVMEQRHGRGRERWRHAVDLYKRVARPILSTCRVFHHTPLQRHEEMGDWCVQRAMEGRADIIALQRHEEMGDWCVLEYAAPDGGRAYAGIFRLGAAGADTYHFRPRGLDVSRRYRVTLDNTEQQYDIAGHDLVGNGLLARAPGALQSELLIFEAL